MFPGPPMTGRNTRLYKHRQNDISVSLFPFRSAILTSRISVPRGAALGPAVFHQSVGLIAPLCTACSSNIGKRLNPRGPSRLGTIDRRSTCARPHTRATAWITDSASPTPEPTPTAPNPLLSPITADSLFLRLFLSPLRSGRAPLERLRNS